MPTISSLDSPEELFPDRNTTKILGKKSNQPMDGFALCLGDVTRLHRFEALPGLNIDFELRRYPEHHGVLGLEAGEDHGKIRVLYDPHPGKCTHLHSTLLQTALPPQKATTTYKEELTSVLDIALKMNPPPIPEDEFVLYADVYAKEGCGDELERLIRILIRMVESEPGTLEYVISRDHNEPNHFFVFERYTGREAFESHCATQEYQNLLNAGLLVDLPQPKILKQLKPI
ncbi:hypothetical protein AYL99_05021 [Fonsecaea erecta]|uniref:ABM domain-containing protein n=1 Tax=Fonsecaea erecta TaxID=1367422 RepID=A0A178ZJN9_9EURO|nr:hypothetical protein AYL99_05021 [Fonsecaea erecta]OAP60019.1 hypothetical protein AYL99_05021 [Fonsecaea erecta]